MSQTLVEPLAKPDVTEKNPLIRLRNVEKCFKTRAGMSYVLRQINLDIAEGEFITIMGPSGAGKSTLLSIVGMLDASWEGEFYFDGAPVHSMAPKQRAELNKKNLSLIHISEPTRL